MIFTGCANFIGHVRRLEPQSLEAGQGSNSGECGPGASQPLAAAKAYRVDVLSTSTLVVERCARV